MTTPRTPIGNPSPDDLFTFEVDGVLAKLSKRQSKLAPRLRARLARFVKIGGAIAAHIKRRTRDERRYFDGTPWRPSGAAQPITVSKLYAATAGSIKQPRTLYDVQGGEHKRVGYYSSARLYKSARKGRGAFSVTDGMWKGLQARAVFDNEVSVLFESSSQGRGKFVRVGETKRGEPIWLRKKKSVRNWQKAGAIFRQRKVNITEASNKENRGIQEGVAHAALALIVEEMDGRLTGTIAFGGDRRLRRRVAQIMER